MGRAGEPEPVGATSPPDPTALAPVLCSLLMWVMTTGTRPLWEERQLRLGAALLALFCHHCSLPCPLHTSVTLLAFWLQQDW